MYFRREWPSGLRHCSKNQKVHRSNPIRHSTMLRDGTLLQGSQWLLSQKWKMQWSTLGEWGCPLNYGPRLAVGQPNSSQKILKNQRFTTVCLEVWIAQWKNPSYEKIWVKKLSNYSEGNFACCYHNQIFENKTTI